MSTCSESSVYWEIDHVQKVYNLIAPHYNDVKHRTWPKVNKFLKNLTPGSLVADVGCGNGRYLDVNPQIYKFGSDICTSFLEQARLGGYEILAADNVALPYRDDIFDAVCSIGVIHHLSSRNRRIRAIQELARVICPGGKVMIYVWAYEQTRRKFTSQDVLIPWIKPEKGGSSRTKMSDMEMNASSSFDNVDSQDEQLPTDADNVNAIRVSGTTCGQTNAYPERPTVGSQHQAVQSCVKRSDLETAEVFNGEHWGNSMIGMGRPRDNSLPPFAIDEMDVNWIPLDADRPKELVSDCKKVGKMLRYLTYKNECRDSPDPVLGEDDERYADSCDEIRQNSDTSAMFWLNEGYVQGHGAAALEKGVCDSSTLKLLDDCPSSTLLSSTRSADSDNVRGTHISESVVPASSREDDTTMAEESLESDSSSSNTSYDSESSQLSAEETIAFPDSTSKSTSFCPFSRSPPEVPSDTSLSESSVEESCVYSELNSRLAVLNSNCRDETCIQSVRYFDDQIGHKILYHDVKHAIPHNMAFPAKDTDTNITADENSDSKNGTENRDSACPQNTTSEIQQKAPTPRKEKTNANKAADHGVNLKTQSSQTNRSQLLYLFAIQQNMKNLYTKLTNAYQTNKKSGSATAHKNSTQGRPPTTIQEPTTRTKRVDEVTLQYYREVCYFPPNGQYQSMKLCLGNPPVKSATTLIQGKRHSFLNFARRFWGANDKTTSEPKAVPEENRKLSLSDALTMIGDGYSEEYIEGKLDSAAKKMFVEMKKVNFGIRQFPRSSVEESHSPMSQQTVSHLNINNSLSNVKETARQGMGRVVNSMQDDLKQLGRDALQNGLAQHAADKVQKGLVQLVENTVQKGLVHLGENTVHNGLMQLAENAVPNGLVHIVENTVQNGLEKLQQNNPFSLPLIALESFEPSRIFRNTVTLEQDRDLLVSASLKPTISYSLAEMPLDISNNATDDSAGSNHTNAPIVDTMFDASSLSIEHVPDAVADQPIDSPSRTPERFDQKRIISSLSRYYHVFREGELENLILEHVPSLLIVDTFYDHANWCVIARKV